MRCSYGKLAPYSKSTNGLCLFLSGVILASLVFWCIYVNNELNWQVNVINRGVAQYSPVTGEFESAFLFMCIQKKTNNVLFYQAANQISYALFRQLYWNLKNKSIETYFTNIR